MKNLFIKMFCLAVLPVFVSGSVLANDEFEEGAEEEFVVERYFDDEIHMRIAEQAKLACKGDRCELASVTNKGESFKVVFSAGFGDQDNANGNGSVVVIEDGGTENSEDDFFVGLQVQYLQGECTQSVHVPESLYIVMNTYIVNRQNIWDS